MHNVFHVQTLAENLPLKITCLHSYENKIYIGAENGSLLLYTVEEEAEFSISLTESRTTPSRKNIEQLCVVPEAGCLAVIADGVISLHDMHSLSLREHLSDVKGVTLLASSRRAERTHVGSKDSSNGAPESTELIPVLCAATKRKVVVFAYRGANLVVLKEIALPDRPRSLVWAYASHTLYIGYNRTISVLNVLTGALKELHSFRTSITASFGNFAPMKQANSLSMDILPDNRILATKDDISIVIDDQGDPVQDLQVQWNSSPSHVVSWLPFVVGLCPGQLEVRTLRTNEVVQQLPLAHASTMDFGHSNLVASSSSIWRLIQLDIEDQIEQLVSSNNFAHAQALVEDLDFPIEADKIANVIRIRGMFAHYLFRSEHRYQEALSILRELQASPLDIINLYPDLAPPDPDGNAETVPPSDKKAVYLLLTYLTEQRALLSKLRLQQEHYDGSHAQTNDNPQVYPILADTLYLSEVVDTTLLKVYLMVNEALVGPLLRVSNYCNVEESEPLLLKREKYDELVGLYRARGLHRKALEFLKEKAISPVSTAAEIEKMVTYLHALNLNENLDLILDYATWILQKDHVEGMRIFTEYYDHVSIGSRKRIVRFLETISGDFAIRYLEYLIDELAEDDPDLNDSLIFCYVANLKRELASRTGLKGPMLPKRDFQNAGGDTFWDLRRKLANFLENSQAYRAEKVLASFPTDALYEERAIVLSRLKRHEEALRIYIEKVRNYRLANIYCEKHHDPDDTESSDVFIILLQLYLDLVASGEHSMSEVHSFMAVYGASIDAAKALEMLPETIPLTNLLGYFERCLHDRHRTRNMNEVIKNLLKAECIQFKERLIHVSSKRIPITDERMCSICLKRIANSVFTHFPNGVVVHAYCASRK
ncbi:vacuolar sorting protein 39 domain 2-domain-containing protein [Powellomyces hirtus]|nr:vacuolar sorting protein 39 domain 2-domain-containing protein [Powellomyces hirtus]